MALSLTDDKNIKYYCNLYNTMIPFLELWDILFPNDPITSVGHPCPLHNEGPDGKSLTYSTERGTWKCWGKCQYSGGSVQFYYLYIRRYQPCTLLEALVMLYYMFPNRVPYPDLSSKTTQSSNFQRSKLRTEIELARMTCTKEFKALEQPLSVDALILGAMIQTPKKRSNIQKSYDKSYENTLDIGMH